MEQDIRYCTAPDGVRIAYSTAGSGPPLVVSSAWVGHLEFEWAQPNIRSFWESVARGRTLVRYDKRGTGLSDWDPADQSLEARVGDLECLADALQLGQFDLMGVSEGGATAITYAVRHPERVARLILYGAYPRLESPKRAAALPALVRAEWGMGSAALSSVFVPSGDPTNVAEFTALERVSASGESAARILEMIYAIDVTGLLNDVAAPTLVIHRKGDVLHPFNLAREIAATIPNARFVPVDGDLYPPWLGDSNAVIRAIQAFLGTDAGFGDDVESPATMRASPAPPRSFASGRYAVQRVLGEGGQKVVYLVHDGALDRECALSMIKSELLDAEDVLRLQREAQAMARLGAHSNIVSVFDFGEEDGTPYLVCEYVPGGDLRQELRSASGSLPLERALAIAGDIARALAIAHGRGIVHRDLKPANVWLNDDGSAKLGDFGLAFSLDRSRLTMPGTVMGTAAYMAPEQALGEPVTARSDLYSLGTLLYQMACGQPPFADENATAVIAQHINARPGAPSKHNPHLPPALDALVLRLLAKSPAERPPSAAAVGAELRQIAQSL